MGDGTQVGGHIDGHSKYARFNFPMGMAVSADMETMYVCDYLGHQLRKIRMREQCLPGCPPDYYMAEPGFVSTLTGSGEMDFLNGDAFTAAFAHPRDMVSSFDGKLVYVSDVLNHRIRVVRLSDGQVWTLAGSGPYADVYGGGFSDGKADVARFNVPVGLAISPDGQTLYVADSWNHRIRAINTTDGYTRTLSGDGQMGSLDRPGETARFHEPEALTISPDGQTLYVGERGNLWIRTVSVVDGSTAVLSGSGRRGAADGPAEDAQFSMLFGMDISIDGSVLFVADGSNQKIRSVRVSDGFVSTLAGSGSEGMADGNATGASFRHPHMVCPSRYESHPQPRSSAQRREH